MAELLVVLAMGLLWSFLYGSISAYNLLVGALLAVLLLSVVRRDRQHSFPVRLWGVLVFLAAFVYELLLAGIAISRLAVVPRPRFHPHVVAVPLRLESDAAITLLSATITLLPGTVAMGISEDGTALYAHAVGTADPEAARRSIRRIEDLILRFMR